MTPRHALLIALAALTIASCTPTPPPSGITELDKTTCIVVEHGRIREVPC